MEKGKLKALNTILSILFLIVMTFVSLTMPTLTLGIIIYSVSYILYVLWVILRFKYLEE